MSFFSPNLIENPLTINPYCDDYQYLAAPTPPSSEERITENNDIRLTEDGNIRITE